jgi:hypothetical protein
MFAISDALKSRSAERQQCCRSTARCHHHGPMQGREADIAIPSCARTAGSERPTAPERSTQPLERDAVHLVTGVCSSGERPVSSGGALSALQRDQITPQVPGVPPRAKSTVMVHVQPCTGHPRQLLSTDFNCSAMHLCFYPPVPE